MKVNTNSTIIYLLPYTHKKVPLIPKKEFASELLLIIALRRSSGGVNGCGGLGKGIEGSLQPLTPYAPRAKLRCKFIIDIC